MARYALRFIALCVAFLAVGCGGGTGGGSAPLAPGGNAPAPLPSVALQSTAGRIGLLQVDDRQMTAAQIQQSAPRYDAVWAAFTPAAWLAGNRRMVVADYFIPQEDRSLISGHDLAWWQANHPDWILYACKADGMPTRALAWMPGVHKPDVPLDIHNPAVAQYLVRELLGPHAIANGYNALATDQVLFDNPMQGGNPTLGQQVSAGYYGCGVYANGSFVRRYTGAADSQYATDIVNFVKAERQILTTDPVLAPHHLRILANHLPRRIDDPNEQALLAIVDAELDETGFADYGNYTAAANSGLFRSTVDYMRYVQSRGIAFLLIDKFVPDGDAVTPLHREYAVATYLMGNEGAAYMYVAPSKYGSEQYYPEYGTMLGNACGPYFGGPAYDAASPHVYYRRFTGGIAVVNSGSLPRASELAHLPSGKAYVDIEQRSVTNPLAVASNDAYVLVTSQNGCM